MLVESSPLPPCAAIRRSCCSTCSARIVEAGDRARRELERDLHDGAQQRLVSLALQLGALDMLLAPGSEAKRILTGARAELAASLHELRDLAHGLHPAYYLVSEALTNIAKHAHASRATVRAMQVGDRLVVHVTDDGTGGADLAGGSGLRGLARRVEALGRTLRVSSSPGNGTSVRADIPIAKGTPCSSRSTT
jgi:signal transduction histidine kinase